jgi:hypothetical protein
VGRSLPNVRSKEKEFDLGTDVKQTIIEPAAPDPIWAFSLPPLHNAPSFGT